MNEVQQKIITIRNTQVMIDEDIVDFYEVEVKRLNEQVKRNIERFPEEFMFQLTTEEYQFLRSQNATLHVVNDVLLKLPSIIQINI